MHPKIYQLKQSQYSYLEQVIEDHFNNGGVSTGYRKPADILKLIARQRKEMDDLIDSIPDEELSK